MHGIGNEFLRAIQIAQHDSLETNKTDIGLTHGFVLSLGDSSFCFVAQAYLKLRCSSTCDHLASISLSWDDRHVRSWPVFAMFR